MDINQIIDSIHLQKIEHIDEDINSVLNSDDHDALFMLGETLYQFGLVPQGLKIFERLFSLYPNEPELLSYYVEGLINENKIDHALTTLHHAPVSPEKLILEADLYQSQGMIEVAMEKLSQAERLAPEESVITFALAELLYYDGQYLQAARRYESLLEIEDEYNQVNLNARLADSLLQAGDIETSLQFFDAIEEQRMTSDDYFRKAIALQKNDLPKAAIETLTTLLDKDPDYMQAYLLLVNLYETERMYHEAIAIGKQGLLLNEFFKELLVDTSRIMLRMNDPEAEQLLIQALTIDPAYTEASLLLSDHYNENEQDEEMIRLFSLIEEDDIDPVVAWNIAQSYRRLERDKEAEHFYSVAFNDLKENKDFLVDYYEYQLELSKDTSSIEQLIIEIDPNFDRYER